MALFSKESDNTKSKEVGKPATPSTSPLSVQGAPTIRCRVGGGALVRWPPSAAQTARAVFPHAAFTKSHFQRDAMEGIN
jgi:hypothetical protein